MAMIVTAEEMRVNSKSLSISIVNIVVLLTSIPPKEKRSVNLLRNVLLLLPPLRLVLEERDIVAKYGGLSK
jgi:hypothetical protein